MNIQQREQNGVIIFELSGRIIGGPDATLLNNRLHELVDGGHRQFVVDLSQIEWMNSSGLGILINAHSMINQAGGKFKIAAASEKIMNLFTITKLVSKFSLYKTMDEALAAF